MTTARYSNSIETVAVGATVGASDPIIYGDFDKGTVYVPSGSTIMTLTWHSSLSATGTYLPARSEANVAITTAVVAGQSYPIPVALSGSRFLKITGDAAGVVGVTLKD